MLTGCGVIAKAASLLADSLSKAVDDFAEMMVKTFDDSFDSVAKFFDEALPSTQKSLRESKHKTIINEDSVEYILGRVPPKVVAQLRKLNTGEEYSGMMPYVAEYRGNNPDKPLLMTVEHSNENCRWKERSQMLVHLKIDETTQRVGVEYSVIETKKNKEEYYSSLTTKEIVNGYDDSSGVLLGRSMSRYFVRKIPKGVLIELSSSNKKIIDDKGVEFALSTESRRNLIKSINSGVYRYSYNEIYDESIPLYNKVMVDITPLMTSNLGFPIYLVTQRSYATNSDQVLLVERFVATKNGIVLSSQAEGDFNFDATIRSLAVTGLNMCASRPNL